MDIFSAIILGIVQGVTEFLPVSSTGHLILVRELLGAGGDNALAFDAVLHLATAGAIIVYFFDDIWILVQTFLRKCGKLPVNERDLTLVYALGIGTIPAVIFGLLLEDVMESLFRHPLLVATVLIVGSIFFMFAEYRYQNNPKQGVIDIKTALKIGLFQTLALIPGFSRSGATIAGGMLLGLTRTESARFAFLLAVPIMLGAGFKKLLDLIGATGDINFFALGFAAVAAFVVGLGAVHFMLSFVRSHSLWPFIWYRIILAGFIFFVFFFG